MFEFVEGLVGGVGVTEPELVDVDADVLDVDVVGESAEVEEEVELGLTGLVVEVDEVVESVDGDELCSLALLGTDVNC